MHVLMQVVRIVIVDAEHEKGAMVVLNEVDGERSFPILIGPFEAYAIDRQNKRSQHSAPHDTRPDP